MRYHKYRFYYFLLLVKISKELIYKVIIYIGLFILTENIIVAILLFAFDVNIYYGHNQYVNIFFGNFLGGSSTGQIRIYSPSQLVAFPIFTLSLAYLLKKKLKINEIRMALMRNHSNVEWRVWSLSSGIQLY